VFALLVLSAADSEQRHYGAI